MDFSFLLRTTSLHPVFSRLSTMPRLSRAHPSPHLSQVVAVSYIELVAAPRKHQVRGGEKEEKEKKVEEERHRICMRGEVLITRALPLPFVTSCSLLLYERIIIGRFARASTHAKFLSRWQHFFRVSHRNEGGRRDRGGTVDRNGTQYTRDARRSGADNYADGVNDNIKHINDVAIKISRLQGCSITQGARIIVSTTEHTFSSFHSWREIKNESFAREREREKFVTL